jgi:succinyl-CoA synthetase alpha subunit
VSILVDTDTAVLVQNITGEEGRFHTRQMLEYGTRVVAGTAPGHGGQSIEGVPVFESVLEAVEATGANAAVGFVPARFAGDAIVEAADNLIRLIVCITEWIPVLDMVKISAHVRSKGCRLVGPNCPGIMTPGCCKMGILPGNIFMPGPVGLVSRSGTLTYEIAWALTSLGIGQSTCVGIGGDPIIGSSFVDILTLFEEDPATEVIGMIGEIGGSDEEEAAAFIASRVTKPVVAFIAGKTAPPDRRMGHAGAIVSSGRGTAEGKIAALEQAGVAVASSTDEAARVIAGLVASRDPHAARCGSPRATAPARCADSPQSGSRSG